MADVLDLPATSAPVQRILIANGQKVHIMPKTSVIHKSKDVLGGTAVFEGTRVPVRTLIDYIEGGDNLDRFLEDFPTVSREQVIQVLELIKNKLIDAVA